MKNPLKLYLNTLSENFKQRKVLLDITHGLARIGLHIIPYYLTQEALQENLRIELSPELASIECSFLTPAEIEKIYNHPETKQYASLEKAFRDVNHLCFALKLNGEIMAFMWCNLDRCHWHASPFALKKDEAFLSDAYTYKKYRGMNLAPYLRYQFYKSLREEGRTKIFSITERLNTPAIKFKKKLGCRHVKLNLFIKPFRLFKWNITLKEF